MDTISLDAWHIVSSIWYMTWYALNHRVLMKYCRPIILPRYWSLLGPPAKTQSPPCGVQHGPRSWRQNPHKMASTLGNGGYRMQQVLYSYRQKTRYTLGPRREQQRGYYNWYIVPYLQNPIQYIISTRHFTHWVSRTICKTAVAIGWWH